MPDRKIIQDDKLPHLRITWILTEKLKLNGHKFMSSMSQKVLEGAGLRLETLVKLRWAAVFGQIAAVLIVYFGFKFQLQFVWCIAVIILSVWLNIFLTIKFKANHRIANTPAAYLLAYDILQLGILLYLTGGLHNPFSIFLLAPTTIAAGSLLLPQVVALNALAIFCASFLVFYHHPLPWKQGEVMELSDTYILGIWSALLVAMAFFGAYAWRVAEERRHMNEALIASEAVLAREQKLSALDGMAAAMAHELGTPLSTINIAAKELFSERNNYADISEDIELIYSQSLKCREVLSKIGRENDDDHMMARMSLPILVSELIDAHQKEGIDFTSNVLSDQNKQYHEDIFLRRNPAIIHGLGNIMSNATKHARTSVDISAQISENDVMLSIEDDGPGFPGEIIEYLGEPVIPRHSQRHKKVEDEKLEEEGLGLGLFIAKTFLERSGAKIIFKNKTMPVTGARVEIIWEKTIFALEDEA